MSLEPQLTLDGRTATIKLDTIFNGMLSVVDEEVLDFLGANDRLTSIISFKEPSGFYGNWVEDPGSGLLVIDLKTALGVLRYIDDNLLTSDVADISEGEDEKNLILGIIWYQHENRVLYLEHEKEEGREEQYHLHSVHVSNYPLKVKPNRRYLKSA